MIPHRATDPYDWAALLALMQRAFAGMEGRISPPSSLHRLTPGLLAATAQTSEVWVLGLPACACMILTPRPDHLYLGKLAVDPSMQSKGLARTLITHAETRARAPNLPALRLETRVELIENHAFFHHMGFAETARTSHPGHPNPTSITFTKPL